MKNKMFAFGQCLRHAFMTGAGYGDDNPAISAEDQQRWVMYDPPETGSFATMAKLVAEEVESIARPTFNSLAQLAVGKDLEFMRKNISNVIRDGSIWRHTGNGAHYRVHRLVLNTITDEWDVEYTPLYPCGIEFFTRQAVNHEKAFVERFVLTAPPNIYHSDIYPPHFREPPKEKAE